MSAHPDYRSGQLGEVEQSHRNVDNAFSIIDRLTRKLARYEHAFDNILTIIDGKADASVEEGRYVGNDYGSIQNEIDEARR